MLSLRSGLQNLVKVAPKTASKARVPRTLAAKAGQSARPLVQKYSTGKGGIRVEKDTFGDINVPADRYWGAQTQRYGHKTSVTLA